VNPTPHEPLLVLSRFGVAFGGTEIVRSLDLAVRHGESLALMGPGGAGKSTVLRTLAGLNDAQPSFRRWGTALYRGEPIGAESRPAIVGQSARLIMSDAFENVAIGLVSRSLLTRREQRERIDEAFASLGISDLRPPLDARVVDLDLATQRILALVRAYVSDAALLLVDEPTAGLEARGRERMLATLATLAERRSLFWVTHDQTAVREVGGRVALLVAGQIREEADAEEFLAEPRTEDGRRFVETGTCYARPSESAPDADRRRATTAPPGPSPWLERGRTAPRGLVWIYAGKLAGLPRPGLLVDLDADLTGLAALGIDVLVCLEESESIPAHRLAAYGIDPLWFPIEDMGVPTVEATTRLCRQVANLLDGSHRVAVHCRAGLGRTGTVLAAFLIWEGVPPLEALERVRALQPRFVQSRGQVDFLSEFGRAIASTNPPSTDDPPPPTSR